MALKIGRFQIFTKQVVQNVAFVEGQTLQQINIPTDLPIARINITLAGTPVGVLGSGSPLAQNQFTVPALARALGLISINAQTQDGSDGVQCKNVPAWQLYFDSWLAAMQKPDTVDIDPATPATACRVTVPITFLDWRLPTHQQILTAMEAQRYGGANNLNLTILTGFLNAANGTTDRTAIIGGTYSTPVTPGTLTISVTVDQVIPVGWNWPAWNGGESLPMLDKDWEYLAQSALNQSQSNNLQLNRRNLQAFTYFFQCSQATTTLAETAVDNLGITPTPQLVERIGAEIRNNMDPINNKNNVLLEFFNSSTALSVVNTTTLAGLFGRNDWQSDLDCALNLKNVSGVHSWDLNMGGTPGGAASQINRMMHVTYNPSYAAQKKIRAWA